MGLQTPKGEEGMQLVCKLAKFNQTMHFGGRTADDTIISYKSQDTVAVTCPLPYGV